VQSCTEFAVLCKTAIFAVLHKTAGVSMQLQLVLHDAA
jgi:hypothetical protein